MPPSDAEEIALVISELVTDTRKHNFFNLEPVRTKVLAQMVRQNIQLFYRDDGMGLPETFLVSDNTGLGMQIIRTSLEKLGRSIALSGQEGAAFRIDLPAGDHPRGA